MIDLCNSIWEKIWVISEAEFAMKQEGSKFLQIGTIERIGFCYALSQGLSGPRIQVQSRSSGVWGRVGQGFSKQVAALT